MHSSSQGYPSSSADLYSSRAYGDHLMGHNTLNSYSNYLGRDDPYNTVAGGGPNYLSGPPPGLQSPSGYPVVGNSLSSLSQHTYPSPASSMSHHFGHHQDVYSSCVSSSVSSPAGRMHPSTPSSSSSYPSPPVLPSLNARHLNSKAYWSNCEALAQQQQQQLHSQAASNHCYSSSSTHKSSPSAWARSPNVLSSPSTTPSPIPCPSTPSNHAHFSSSPAHHGGPHSSESHKSSPYNGLNLAGSSGGSSNASTGQLNCNANPLQSLQKMVQIDNTATPDGGEALRSPFDTSAAASMVAAMNAHAQQQQQSHAMLESDPNYPTYYNLDQNRLCATPQSGYSNMSAQSIGSGPFSPSMPKSAQQSQQALAAAGCIKMENSLNDAEGSPSGGGGLRSSASSLRFSSKQAKGKETLYANNGSCSTDTCSNESVPAAAPHNSAGGSSKNAIGSMTPTDVLGQAEQTHDSFRGSETTRDSVKSSDSEGTYGVSQGSTPTHSWKMAPGSEFRSSNASSFTSNAHHGKLWWAENGAAAAAANNANNMPLAGGGGGQTRASFGGSECAAYAGYAPGAPVGGAGHPNTPSSSSISPGWPSQQQQQQGQASQLVAPASGNIAGFTTQPDGSVIVKKKRGRPFGSKNRRNLEAAAQGAGGVATAAPTAAPTPHEAYKRRRKIVCVDVGVNTSLSFDVHGILSSEDAYLFTDTGSLKHNTPLAMKRKKIVGPVIRIDKINTDSQPKYSVVNSVKFLEEEKDLKVKGAKLSDSSTVSYASGRKNGLNNGKRCSMLSGTTASHTTINKNWFCILCHKGPNHKGLGDLYGPYFITLERSKLPSLHEYDGNNNNTSNLTTSTTLNENNHHHHNHEESESSSFNEQHPASERRSSLRRRQEPNDDAAKQNKSTNHAHLNHHTHAQEQDKDLGKTNLEVWIHEDCIVWSNNVYLDGTKIRNLEPAIVESFDNVCTKCKLPGATLGCIFKNCTVTPLHYLCAKEKDCDLDEEKFILSCSKHKKRRVLSKEPEVAAVELSEATTTTTSEN